MGIPISNLDNDSDSPRAARADLLALVNAFNAIYSPSGDGLSTSAVLDAIAGSITESELHSTLGQTIGLITAPDTTANSVAQRIKAEADARSSAVSAEAAARVAAVSAEATARTSAITTAVAGVQTNLDTEVTNRIAAVSSEATARAAAILAEATARGTAITNEATLRQSGDDQLATSITTLTSTVNANTAAISAETTARTTADSANATATDTLATQLRGNYAGSDIALLTSGLLHSERQARSTADTAMASSIATLQASVGVQIDAAKSWYFDVGIEGWSGNGTPTWSGGSLVPANHASDPYVSSSTGLGIDASKYAFGQMRVRKVGSPVWAGQFRWRRTSDVGWDDVNRMVSLTEPAYDDQGFGVISFSIKLAAWSATIDLIRVDLSTAQSGTDGYQIDWIAVGRQAPAASVASVTEEAAARAAATSAEVALREALSTKLTGFTDPSGTNLAFLSSGLLYEERTARSTADSTEVSARRSLSTKLTGLNDPASATLASLSAGLIFDERNARSTADATEVTQRQALSTKLTGLADPSGATLATLTSGLVYDERSARSTADASEVSARQSLSALLTGATDPTGLSLATLSSGIIFDEKTARATAVSAVASSVTALTARVDAVRKWSNTVSITSGLVVSLKMANGTTGLSNSETLFAQASNKGQLTYKVSAKISSGTSGATGAVSVFKSQWNGTAWEWVHTVVYENGTTAQNVKLYLNGGVPSVALYNTTTTYTVVYDVELLLSAYSPEAAVLDEVAARTTADSAEVVQRQALSTKMTGLNDPSSVTLASLTAGLIYEERTARSTADATEVSARQALSTKMTGLADPSSATLATLTSGLIFEERTARSTDIASTVSRISQLETSAGSLVTFNGIRESFESQAVFNTDWVVNPSYNTGNPVVVAGSDAISGGSYLRIGDNSGNDRARINSVTRIPVSADTLYKLRYVARRPQGAGVLYVGFVAYGSDGATIVNRVGNNADSSHYYVLNDSQNPGTSWASFTGYFKLGSVYGGTGTLTNPTTFRAETRYISLMVWPNQDGLAGITEIDSIDVDYLAAEVVAHETSITTLQSTVNAPATGNTALASRATALEATVNNATTGVAATATALDTVELLVNDATKGNNSLATRTTALESTVNNGTSGVAATYASLTTNYYTKAAADSAIASSVATVNARLNTGGDVYNSVVTATSTANAASTSSGTNATNITNVQSWIQSKGTNLIQNSSMEILRTDGSGIPAGWGGVNSLAVNASVSASAGRTGGKALSVKFLAASTGTHGVYSTQHAPLATAGVLGGWKANTTYVVSFYAKRVNGSAFTTTALSFSTAPSSTTAILNPALQTSWQRYAFRIVWGASVTASGMLSILRNGTSAANDEFVVDDIMVTEGTELEGYTPGLGDGVGQVAAVQTEISTRATETGYLGSQYTVRMTAGNIAGGFGLSGTSGGGAGATIDFGVRANKFYIAPPEGSSVTQNIFPFTVYTTATTLASGVVVQPGVYMSSAYVDYISASQIDSRGLTIKDASGNVILSAGVPLEYNRISGTSRPGSLNLFDLSWMKAGATIPWSVQQSGPVDETAIVLSTGYNALERPLFKLTASALNKLVQPEVGSSLSVWFPGETQASTEVATVVRDTAATGWTADGSTTYSGPSFRVTKTALAVQSQGIASRAIAVTPGETLRIRVRVRGNTATASGLYVRVNEAKALPGTGAINATNRFSTTSLVSNTATTTTYTTYQNLTYTVPSEIVAISLSIFSWANGPTVLYVDDPTINRTAFADSSVGPRQSSEGGFQMNSTAWVPIDPTRTYRFISFVKREVADPQPVATVYHGVTGGLVCSFDTTTNTVSATANSNPYFCNAGDLIPGEWYVAVGYVYPANSLGHQHSDAGFYRLSTGTLHSSYQQNYCWHPNTTAAGSRTFQYAADEGAVVWIDSPSLHLVDGTEPPLRSYFNDTTQLNSAISLTSSGTLLGAGGGAVTITGLGYSGALDASSGSNLVISDVTTSSQWTPDRTGDPAIMTSGYGTPVTDPIYGKAMSWDIAAVGGTFTTRSVMRPQAGRVYRTTIEFYLSDLVDTSSAFNVVITPMDVSYALLGSYLITAATTVFLADTTVVLSYEFGFATPYSGSFVLPAGTTYVRAGLRLNETEASALNVRVKAIEIVDVTEGYVAKANADAALSQLTNLASDNILSPAEKPLVKREYDTISAEQLGLDTQANSFGVTAEKITYDGAVSSLASYMLGLTGWNTIPGSDVTIVGTTFRQKFQNVYVAKQALINAIAAKAKVLADAAQTTANTADANASLANLNATTAANAALTAQNSATAANNTLADIASDSKLTPTEKLVVRREWDAVVNEKAGINTQATGMGVTAVTTANTAYNTALQALGTYLNAGSAYTISTSTPPSWISDSGLSSTTTIVGSTFRSNWTSMYNARQALLNAVATASKAAADAAQTTANTAATDSTAALNQLTNLSSDNILSPLEKPAVKKEYDVLIAEQSGIDTRATAAGITTQKTTYDTAVTALTTYLSGLTGWNTIPGSDVTIVGTTFRQKFQDVYSARQTLLNKVDELAATTANWNTVSNIPYATIFNNDDSVALGFNPTFSWKTGTYPANWVAWSGSAPTKETTLVRIGTEAVRWVVAATNDGMYHRTDFPTTPLPAGTFLAGSFDVYLVARTSGLPGILVRLFTNSAMTTYVDTMVQPPSTNISQWQRVPFTARVGAGQQIYSIQIFVMASWTAMTGGAFTGTVIFDNLRFMLADSTTDNTVVKLNESGGTVSLTGAGGGSFTTVTANNKINTGNVSTYITAGAIDNAYIGKFISSTDFNGVINASGVMTNVGTQGWAIAKGDGTAGSSKMVVDAAHIRGQLTVGQVNMNPGRATAGCRLQPPSTPVSAGLFSHLETIATSLVASGYAYRVDVVGCVDMFISSATATLGQLYASVECTSSNSSNTFSIPELITDRRTLSNGVLWTDGSYWYTIPISFSWVINGDYWIGPLGYMPGVTGLPRSSTLRKNSLNQGETWTLKCSLLGNAGNLANARITLSGAVTELPGVSLVTNSGGVIYA